MKFKSNKIYFMNLRLVMILLSSLILWVNEFKIWSIFILVVYSIYSNVKLLKLIEKDNNGKIQVQNLSSKINKVIEENILNLIYPICILNSNGEILWHNKKFQESFSIENTHATNLVSVIRGISLNKILKCDRRLSQKIKVKKIIYEVYGRELIVDEKNKFCIVHFNDVTYVTEGTKESIMLLEVDNLNEVIKTVEDDIRPLLIAEIERTITNYAHTVEAMIKKYDTNKYVLSISDSMIEKEINKGFNILDMMREVEVGNKMEVTLSIGVGRGGKTPHENQKYAVTAKELALGRGGDQAVIKTVNDLSFFGGNTKELEKRTRVRARVIATALQDLIYESSDIYIMGHKNPDMDCFGAALGIASVVRQLGKHCKIVLNNDTKAIEFFMNKIKNKDEYKNLFITSTEAMKNIDENSLMILVDAHSKNYISDNKLLTKTKRVVIIDHHRRSPDCIEGALLNYIEVYASSTSELVTEMVQYMLEKPKLNRIEAEGLLAGICMDTKNFSFKTGVRTFEAASFLRRLGADTIEIKKMFSNDLESYIIKSEIIKSAEVDNKIAIAVCPKNITEIITAAQAADELINITGIEASFVFVKIEKDIYISGRSLGDINVQVILETLGGGGHMTMAGAKLNDIDIKEAKNKLKDAISKYLKEGD